MELLAGHIGARPGSPGPADHNPILLGVNLDLIARQARKFRGEHELVGSLIEIDRGSPARRIGADELSNLLVKCEQIVERVPPCESHRFAS